MKKEEELAILLEELKNDNKECLSEMYDIIHNDIFRYIYSIVKSKEYAQDLVHDTFLHIYKNVHMYQHKGKAIAWILTIARNITYMSLKKESREYQIEIKENNPLSQIHNKIIIEKIMEILSREEREIVVLHIVEGFAFHEIASIVNLKLSTVLSKYHRSLKKLRKCMEVLNEDELY